MRELIAVDTSVLIAILKGESEETLFRSLLSKSAPVIGWPTVLETRIWLVQRGTAQAQLWLEDWLAKRSTRAVAFDCDLERLAASAYGRFGKGRHPAALNFGDAMTYAVARHHDVPLLFKGGDFGKTDLKIHEASVAPA